MIFRKYRTLFMVIVIIGLVSIFLMLWSHVGSLPVLKGDPQGIGASYPLKSEDRSLLDLNGSWKGFSSLGAAGTALGPSVQRQVYNVTQTVYGTNIPGASVPVPGSWDWPVVATQFVLSNNWAGKDFRLHLLGLEGRAEVFVNGFGWAESIGTVNEIPAVLNIPSPRLKFGQVNTIVVKLDEPASSWRWFRFPGLTGEVYLEAVGPLVLGYPQLTTALTDGGAELSYQIPLNSKSQEEGLTGQVSLSDANGEQIAVNDFNLKNGQLMNATGKFNLAGAKLWSPEDPYLYRLQVSVNGGRGERDSYSVPVGLRVIKIAGNQLQVNGKKLAVKMLQRVNDTKFSGGAINHPQLEKDLIWAKDKGYNVLLLPDGPPHPYLLDLADKYGLLVLGQAINSTPGAQSGPRNMIGGAQLSWHPSLLARGLGEGLDLTNTETEKYIKSSAALGPVFYTAIGRPDRLLFPGSGELEFKAPYLADFLSGRPSFKSGDFETNRLNPVGMMTRARAEKGPAPESTRLQPVSPIMPLAAGFVALLTVLGSWGAGNLRFASLTEKKFPRKIRSQVRTQAVWYLLRLTILALIFAGWLNGMGDSPLLGFAVSSIPWQAVRNLLWFALSTPWAMVILSLSLGLSLSYLLAWPRARSLPQRPGVTAYLLWAEKRKRWIVLALGAWIYTAYAGQQWIVWAALGAGYLLSIWGVRKDLKWAGGRTFNLLYFSGILVAALGIIVYNKEFIIYIYHWIKL